jgi:hypothetical protein
LWQLCWPARPLARGRNHVRGARQNIMIVDAFTVSGALLAGLIVCGLFYAVMRRTPSRCSNQIRRVPFEPSSDMAICRYTAGGTPFSALAHCRASGSVTRYECGSLCLRGSATPGLLCWKLRAARPSSDNSVQLSVPGSCPCDGAAILNFSAWRPGAGSTSVCQPARSSCHGS